MSPITHLLISWTAANSFKLSRKERILITISGVIPDIDGLGLIFDFLFKNPDRPLQLWSKFHHVLGHNLGLGIIAAVIAFALSQRRWTVALFSFFIFHVHLFCDVIGARGPDGYQWPIPYLLPFSGSWQLTWSGQWALNAWPNFLVTGVSLFLVFYIAWKYGRSPIEIVSTRLDNGFVNALRTRFGKPSNPSSKEKTN